MIRRCACWKSSVTANKQVFGLESGLMPRAARPDL